MFSFFRKPPKDPPPNPARGAAATRSAGKPPVSPGAGAGAGSAVGSTERAAHAPAEQVAIARAATPSGREGPSATSPHGALNDAVGASAPGASGQQRPSASDQTGAASKAAAKPAGTAGAIHSTTGTNPHAQGLTQQIDQIEAEMRRSLQSAAKGSTASGVVPQAFSSAPLTGHTLEAPELGNADFGATTGFDGKTTLALDALVVEESSLHPAIEAAAVQYASGDLAGAQAGLEAALRGPDLGASTQLAWLMLLELYRFSGQRERFDALGLDYAARFECSPPIWMWAATPTKRTAAPGLLEYRPGAALDDTETDKLAVADRQLQSKPRGLIVVADAVRRIDVGGAARLFALLDRARRARIPVALENGEHLLTALRESVQQGRRDPSDAVWLLLLETYRLLGREQEFEDACIEYAVTYEVSPPSWEAPAAIPVVQKVASQPSAESSPLPPIAPDALVFEGHILGTDHPQLEALFERAQQHTSLEVDCRGLERLDFAAGSTLLTHLFGLQHRAAQIRFTQVGPLIYPILLVLGLQDLVQVERRRI